jgi:hypothetical protein
MPTGEVRLRDPWEVRILDSEAGAETATRGAGEVMPD